MKTSWWIMPSILAFILVTSGIMFSGNSVLAQTTEGHHPAKQPYWNQFRGPNGDGEALATNLPVEFSETQNIRWKTPIHDKGWSSPVVWEDQIWLTTALEDGRELFAVCVDLNSGKIIHDIKVFDVSEPQLEYPDLNTHATPTPIVEDGRVYVHFGTYGTACLDTKSGEKLWERRDLNCDHRVRPASSPIIDGDSLFLTFDGVDVQFVASLDKNTGDTLWLQNRVAGLEMAAMLKAEGFSDDDIEETEKDKPGDNRKSYATPTIIEYQGNKQLISPGPEVTFSYAPNTGEELWRVRHPNMGFNVACRPLFEHGLVYFTTGVAKRLLAVRPSGTGDVTDTHIAWSTRKGTPEIPSPLIQDMEKSLGKMEKKSNVPTLKRNKKDNLLAEYQVIVDNNLFRPLGWGGEKPNNLFRLVGTVIDSSSQRAKAIITRTENPETFFVSKGDIIGNGYKVEEISANEVKLANAEKGENFFMQLDWNPLGGQPSKWSSTRSSRRSENESAESRAENRKPSAYQGKDQSWDSGKPTGKRELSKREIEAWTELKQSTAWKNASPEEREKMAEEMQSKLDGNNEDDQSESFDSDK